MRNSSMPIYAMNVTIIVKNSPSLAPGTQGILRPVSDGAMLRRSSRLSECVCVSGLIHSPKGKNPRISPGDLHVPQRLPGRTSKRGSYTVPYYNILHVGR